MTQALPQEARRAHFLSRVLLSPWLYHAARLPIAALFLYAGLGKLRGRQEFADAIAAYGILPDWAVPAFALGLPALEVAAGLAALLNRRWGLYAIAGMMALFVGVLAYGVSQGLDIDCGCFSFGSKPRAAAMEVPPATLSGPADLGMGGLEIPGADQAVRSAEGTCAEKVSDGPSPLRTALYRDLLLLPLTGFLIAWPWLRRRAGLP